MISAQTHRHRTVPAVRSVTVSSRPDRGLCFETVQPTVSRSYLPDGLVWPGVTLARSLCLFSVCCCLTHLPPSTHNMSSPARYCRRVENVTEVTYKQYPWCNNVTFALCWDLHSHWYRCCVTCRHSMKDRRSSFPPLPICLRYCTTDAHVFFTYFLLLCLPCGKTDYYLSKWQLSEISPFYTWSQLHCCVYLSGWSGSFWCLSITYGKEKMEQSVHTYHNHSRWILLFFYLFACGSKWGGLGASWKMKKQQKAPCFGC